MILTVHGDGETWWAETPAEKSELVRMAVEEQQYSIPHVGAGDNLVFMLDRRRWTSGIGWWPDNCLHVSVNSSTGYGGLIWWVTPQRAMVSGDKVSQSCWVSDNPGSPNVDPMIFAVATDHGDMRVRRPRWKYEGCIVCCA